MVDLTSGMHFTYLPCRKNPAMKCTCATWTRTYECASERAVNCKSEEVSFGAAQEQKCNQFFKKPWKTAVAGLPAAIRGFRQLFSQSSSYRLISRKTAGKTVLFAPQMCNIRDRPVALAVTFKAWYCIWLPWQLLLYIDKVAPLNSSIATIWSM